MHKIIIIDDQKLFANGLKSILDEIPDVEVINVYPDGIHVNSKLRFDNPDIIFLDLNLPGKNGLEILQEVREEFPELTIAILTMYSDEGLAKLARKYGANAYLSKDAGIEELKNVIFNNKKYEFYLGKNISTEQSINVIKPDKFSEIIQLSSREKEIIMHIAEGKSSNEIGEELFISPATVQTHRKNIFNKLKISKVSELVKFAYENNII